MSKKNNTGGRNPKNVSNCERIFGVRNHKCSICGGVDGSCGHPEMR